MTTAPPLTPTGSQCYFPTVVFPDWLENAADLRALLLTLAQDSFGDIDRGAERPVEEAFEAVLDALVDAHHPARTHRRYVFLGLTLALASQAWIHEYTPRDQRAGELTRQVEDWLTRGTSLTSPINEELYPLVATRYQELDEDRDVHRRLSLMPTNAPDCRALLLDMLDATIVGYAVHPSGGLARRDLFHWWLSQAVPAAYMERLPDHIYSGSWPWPPRAPEPSAR